MRRFAKNRWLAFILTLSILIASSTTLASSSFAGGPEPLVTGGGTGGGGGSPGGDPDGPAGPSKRLPRGSRVTPGGFGYAMTSVGDGGRADGVWVWRFHVVLQALISRYSR